MKLSELHPRLLGAPDGLNELLFDCPKCGAPMQVYIRCRLNGPADAEKAIWKWSHPDEGVYSMDAITIEPSINNATHGRTPCGWHGSIINGEVIGG